MEVRMAALNTTSSPQVVGKTVAPPAPQETGAAKSGIISAMASRVAMDRPVDRATKQSMIAEAAYYCAEKRGFAPGHDLDDWLAAEVEIEVLTGK